MSSLQTLHFPRLSPEFYSEKVIVHKRHIILCVHAYFIQWGKTSMLTSVLLLLSTSVCCMMEQVTNDNNNQKPPHSSALCQLYNLGSVAGVDLHLTLASCDIRSYLFSLFALIQCCMLYCTHLLVYPENHILLRAVIQRSAVHTSWLLLNFLSVCPHYHLHLA